MVAPNVRLLRSMRICSLEFNAFQFLFCAPLQYNILVISIINGMEWMDGMGILCSVVLELNVMIKVFWIIRRVRVAMRRLCAFRNKSVVLPSEFGFKQSQKEWSGVNTRFWID